MKPPIHIAISFTVSAAFYFLSKSILGSFLCFASGIFLDFDHVIEYIIHFGFKNLSFRHIYYVCEQTCKQEGDKKFDKLYLIFHSNEAAILLWITAVCVKNLYI